MTRPTRPAPSTARGLVRLALAALLAAALLALAGSGGTANALTASGAIGPLTPKDVVYQIITDRFVDGDTTNNKPSGFDPTLFDDPDGNNVGNGADLKLYQGGDWQGIINKITYLKNMGITAVWISTTTTRAARPTAGRASTATTSATTSRRTSTSAR
jgi:cyclomaltodextrin glucanotransferase